MASEIQLIQNLFENCLQLYMNIGEILSAFKLQANVDEEFTKLGIFKMRTTYFFVSNCRFSVGKIGRWKSRLFCGLWNSFEVVGTNYGVQLFGQSADTT